MVHISRHTAPHTEYDIEYVYKLSLSHLSDDEVDAALDGRDGVLWREPQPHGREVFQYTYTQLSKLELLVRDTQVCCAPKKHRPIFDRNLAKQ